MDPVAAPATPATPATRGTGGRIGVGLGIVAVAAAGGLWLTRHLVTRKPAAPTAPMAKQALPPARARPADPAQKAAPRTGPVTIAVLPFKNLTGTSALQPLAEGLTESVITGFAGAEGIHLVEHVQIGADVHYQAWTHSKYVDPATRARIGKIVGCEVVVLGGYQKAGHVLRATARLVRVDTGEILAAVEVERPQAKVFALQDAVAKALRGDLPAVEKVLRP